MATTTGDDPARRVFDVFTWEHWSDSEWIAAIHAADDPSLLSALIYHFYADADRAGRQSRSLLYLHMGFLGGTILRLLERVARAERGAER
jgi:hypothetical protein